MCYFSGRLYLVTGRRNKLQVYSVNDQDTITLLDTLHMPDLLDTPRVDRQSGRIYIACYGDGVFVVKYDGSKLLIVTTLRCVKDVTSLAVVSPDTLYVCDENSKTICLVDVIKDRVIQRLQKPLEVHQYIDTCSAFLGDTLLVCHKLCSMTKSPSKSSSFSTPLVIYRHGASTPGKVISPPKGVSWVGGPTTDNHSNFLLIGGHPLSVYVLDISGGLIHTIPIFAGSRLIDCTVVGEKLWVGCENGEIIVMSSL